MSLCRVFAQIRRLRKSPQQCLPFYSGELQSPQFSAKLPQIAQINIKVLASEIP